MFSTLAFSLIVGIPTGLVAHALKLHGWGFAGFLMFCLFLVFMGGLHLG